MPDDTKRGSQLGPSPYDTVTSATLRFAVEVIAWVAGPWAVASLTGIWFLAIPVALLLVVATAVFSTPGDKDNVIVPTPGPLRLALEITLGIVAVLAAWLVWPTWVAVIVTLIVLAAAGTGWRRAVWLAHDAPPADGQ